MGFIATISQTSAEAFTSGLLSGGSAVLFGSPALFVPAMLTGAGTAVVRRALEVVGADDAILRRTSAVEVGFRRKLAGTVAITLVVVAVSAFTVAPAVGMLGTAYKVHWVGSFVMTVLVNMLRKGGLFPNYFMVPATFGPLAAAWALQAVTKARSLARS